MLVRLRARRTIYGSNSRPAWHMDLRAVHAESKETGK